MTPTLTLRRVVFAIALLLFQVCIAYVEALIPSQTSRNGVVIQRCGAAAESGSKLAELRAAGPSAGMIGTLEDWSVVDYEARYAAAEAEYLTQNALQLETSVQSAMGGAYQAMGEVTAPIKNVDLLKVLSEASEGNWVKVYEAGIQDGNQIEVHYFRNETTKRLFDVKKKYDAWHQDAFKKIKYNCPGNN